MNSIWTVSHGFLFDIFKYDWKNQFNSSLFPKDLLSRIPSPVFNRIIDLSKLSSQGDHYIADVLRLNDPIPTYYVDIIKELKKNNVIDDNTLKNSQFLVLQYEILLVYQMSQYINGVIEEHNESISLFERFNEIFSFFIKYENISRKELLLILEPFIFKLISVINNSKSINLGLIAISAFKNYLNTILSVFPHQSLSISDYFTFFDLVFSFLSYFAIVDKFEFLNVTVLDGIFAIINKLLEKKEILSVQYMIKNKEHIFDILLSMFTRLSFALVSIHSEKFILYQIGRSILLLLSHSISTSIELSSFFYDHQKRDEIGLFVSSIIRSFNNLEKLDITNFFLFISFEEPTKTKDFVQYRSKLSITNKSESNFPKILPMKIYIPEYNDLINSIVLLTSNQNGQSLLVSIFVRCLSTINFRFESSLIRDTLPEPILLINSFTFLVNVLSSLPIEYSLAIFNQGDFLDFIKCFSRIAFFEKSKFVYFYCSPFGRIMNYLLLSVYECPSQSSIVFIFVTSLYSLKDPYLSLLANSFLLQLSHSIKVWVLSMIKESGLISTFSIFYSQCQVIFDESLSFLNIDERECLINIRLSFFEVINEISLSPLLCSVCFANPLFTSCIISHYFEDSFHQIIGSLLVSCFKLGAKSNDTKMGIANIFQEIIRVLRIHISKGTLSDNIHHINDLILIVHNHYDCDPIGFCNIFQESGFLYELSISLAGMDCEKHSDNICELILMLLRKISKGYKIGRKFICKHSMDIIIVYLSKMCVTNTILNHLMSLCFESDFNFEMTKNLEIKNHRMIHFLHEIFKGTDVHVKIFKTITSICQTSPENRIQVFKSNIIRTTLQYMASYSNNLCIPPAVYNSINVLLELFCIVSSFVFKWTTLSESIVLMMPQNGFRLWTTSILISAFTKVLLSNDTHKPSSFYRFSGKDSKMILPKISSNLILKGFSLYIRFQIDSVNSRPDSQYCLLNITNSTNQTIVLSIINQYLCFEIGDNHNNVQIRDIIPYSLEYHVWYSFIVYFSSNDFQFFINGINVHSVHSAKLRFDCSIDECMISSFSQRLKSRNYSDLVSNIGFVFIFSGMLSDDIIKSLSHLPFDFVDDPTINKSFSSLKVSLICGFNAKFTIDQESINFGNAGLGNASINCHVMNETSSFSSIVLNYGGLSLFLPLFEQVNMTILGNGENDSSSFLYNLLTLLTQFLIIPSLVDLFVKKGGFESLSFLMNRINSEHIQKCSLVQLNEIYYSLQINEHKFSMLNSIFLNVNLWNHLSKQNKYIFLKDMTLSIIQTSTEIIRHSYKIGYFLSIINQEDDLETRIILWDYVRIILDNGITDPEQDFYLFFTKDLNNIIIQLESIKVFFDHFLSFFEKSHRFFVRHGIYEAFLFLFASESLEIKKMGLSVFFLLCDFNETVGWFKNGFDNAVIEISFKVEESADMSFVNYCMDLFFNPGTNHKYFLFALLCAVLYSCFEECLNGFLAKLEKIIIQSPEEYCSNIIKINHWYFWYFRLLIKQSGFNVLISSSFSQTVSLILSYSLENSQRSVFHDCISFILALQFVYGYNASSLFHSVFINLMKIQKDVSPRVVLMITTEIFLFLFYIPIGERFCENVELKYLSGIKPELIIEKKIYNPFHINEVYLILENFNTMPQYVFSSRIDENGIWYNIELALEFLIFVKRFKAPLEQFIWLAEAKMSFLEICAIIVGFIIRNDRNKFPIVINFLEVIFMNSNHKSSSNMIIYDIFSVVREYPDSIGFFNQALSILSKNLNRSITNFSENQRNHEYDVEIYYIYRDIYSPIMNILSERSDNISRIVFGRIKSLIKHFSKNEAESVMNQFSFDYRSELSYFQQLSDHQRIFSEKCYIHILREQLTNGGPWSSRDNSTNWKLLIHYDSLFRRLVLKPNITLLITNQLFHNKPNTNIKKIAYKSLSQEFNLGNNDNSSFLRVSSSINARLVFLDQSYEGMLLIDDKRICFTNKIDKSIIISFTEIEMVLYRSYRHIDTALEFFTRYRKSYFIDFPDGDRQTMITLLRSSKLPYLKYLQNKPSDIFFQECSFTNQWMNGELSNFQYLMLLNLFSGRSYNDLSQYPVFPWTISDYSSQKLDLENPSIYRDLTKPLGALNNNKLEKLKEIMKEIPEGPDKCLYRFHYSSSFGVVHYLIRIEPFMSIHMKLHDNKLDHESRLFSSIEQTWHNILSDVPMFLELTPEFFYLPEIFDGCYLRNDSMIPKMELPPWAKNSTEFVDLNLKALESMYVSSHINHWIDLIFGFKQYGTESELSNNVYHKYCYPQCITKSSLANNNQLLLIQNVADSIGIVPKQLFTTPHPKKLMKSVFDFSMLSKSLVINVLHKGVGLINVFCDDCNIYLVSVFYEIYQIPILSNNQIDLKSFISNSPLKPGLNEAKNISKYKNMAFNADSKRFISLSIDENIFRVFSITKKSITLDMSVRSQNTMYSMLITTGRSFIMTSHQDFSLYLWDFSGSVPLSPLYRITPQASSLADFDISNDLDLVITVSKDKIISMNHLYSGKYIKTCQVFDEGEIQKIGLVSSGYIYVVFLHKDNSNFSFCTYSLQLKKLYTKGFGNNITIIKYISIGPNNHVLVVVKNDGTIIIISLPKLEILWQTFLNGTITEIVFSKNSKEFYFTTKDGVFGSIRTCQ